MKWLTKSDYIKYLSHPAYLWLAKHAKDKLPEITEVDQAVFSQGYEVQSYAHYLWPEGREVGGDLFENIDLSAQAMADDSSTVLFEVGVLTARRLYVRADVIARRENGWDIYEIKSSTRVKDTHLHDLAFQKIAFEEAGYSIRGCFVVHIDQHYERAGDIEPEKLLSITEVTEEVTPLLPQTSLKINEALSVINSKSMPDDSPELAANWKEWKSVYKLLHPDIPADSVLNLCRVTPGQLRDFRKLGIERISNIPIGFPSLKSAQTAQIEAAVHSAPRAHPLKISHQLNALIYPLYFLDYETFSTAVPLWDGVRPYQQLPFQYSLHVIEKPGAEAVHREFLARGTDYPVLALLEQLSRDIGSRGSVIVWHKPFEMGCNSAMGAIHADYKEFLEDVNSRVFDLKDIFSEHAYVDPRFFGSASIKKVLPVLAPDLSYEDMNIGEGMLAQVRWTRAARGQTTPNEAAAIYDDLIEYCGQDTLAMVRIYQFLLKTVNDSK